jgi:hypothetical protein
MIDLLSLTSHFKPLNDHESEAAWFRTLLPWVGPEAYLNVIHKPAPPGLLFNVAQRWHFPEEIVDFLEHQNGAMLFCGALNLYGVVEPARLLNREDTFSLPPFNIEDENASWAFQRDRLLVVGGYMFDGSRACIDRSDSHIHIFKKGQRIPTASWPSFETWLVEEISRLRTLFDGEGRKI